MPALVRLHLPLVIAAFLVGACGAIEALRPTPTMEISLAPRATASAITEQSDPPAGELSINVAIVPRGIPPYDRDEWAHWLDADGDCQNARHEVLIAESRTPVRYWDAGRCRVASGRWIGPYTGEQFDEAGELDIDHMVPLANAHWSGGWAWSDERKARYANDLSYEGHLVAASASANRSKRADGPEDWRPPDRSYRCQYAVDWVTIKNRWDLTAVEAEAVALREMLGTCDPPRGLRFLRPEAPHVAATASPPRSTGARFGSCDAAEAAGEPLVRGSRGAGRGFPQDSVPGARDGDGDGVVCER